MKTIAERMADNMIEVCKDGFAEYNCHFTREGPAVIKFEFPYNQATVTIDFEHGTIADQGSMEDWFGAENKEELIDALSTTQKEKIVSLHFEGDNPEEDDCDVTLVLKFNNYEEMRKDLAYRGYFENLELDKIFAAKTEE